MKRSVVISHNFFCLVDLITFVSFFMTNVSPDIFQLQMEVRSNLKYNFLNQLIVKVNQSMLCDFS